MAKCRSWRESQFMQGKPIVPPRWKKGSTIVDLIENYDATCFEARNIAAGAKLLKRMIEEEDTIWLGVAGAGPACGMGGYIIDLIESGFVDAICSTGAQVYHDGHFAFGLPVVQGSPHVDDAALDADGTVRIFDTFIRLPETLEVQDALLQKFARTLQPDVIRSTADYNAQWGKYIQENAPHPELSWVAFAWKQGVPVFLDSESNHSIGMSNAALFLESRNVDPSPSRSLLEGAAINFHSHPLGFLELGGGGPKNWIQTMGPMISQVLKIKYEGADRGIQITTASEREGGLSGCTFGEAISWGKYKDDAGLVQIWGEYSHIAPLLVGYAVETCKPREPKRLMDKKEEYYKHLVVLAKERDIRFTPQSNH